MLLFGIIAYLLDLDFLIAWQPCELSQSLVVVVHAHPMNSTAVFQGTALVCYFIKV